MEAWPLVTLGFRCVNGTNGRETSMTKNPAGKKKLWCHLGVFIALFIGVGSAAVRLDAQVVGATLSGTITDSSGGVVPNAQITVRNSATDIVQTVTSNADGVYSAPNLQPGNYTVKVSASGLAQLTAKATLTVGAKQQLNLTLSVVGISQNVEVTVDVPTVNLEDAALGGINDEATVKELPLNGRSWSDLAALQPGVYTIRTQPGVTAPDRFNRGLGDQLSIAGTRPTGNNYRLNVISINDDSNGGPGSVLGGNMGVDAISEFSVLTTNYSAEYGRASGGIINAITKSGTNSFHGNVYEFLRNSSLDARNFFDPAGGPKRLPPFRRNQFGASGGGRILKDKTFIFADYEGLRQYLNISQVDAVPSAAARAGVLTSPAVSAYSLGGPPLPANFSCPAGSSLPMPGVSNTCVDDQATRYLKAFYPLPNGQLFGDTGFYSLAINQPTTENYFTFRVDHKISDKDRLSVSYFRDNSNVTTDDQFRNLSSTTLDNRYYVALDETHVLNATTVNDFRVGFSRLITGFPSAVQAINPAVTDTSLGFRTGESAGRIIIGGVTFFGGGVSAHQLAPSAYNAPQIYDDVIVTKGVHSIKFGFAFEHDQLNRVRHVAAAPSYVFGTLSNFLTNVPLSLNVSSQGTNTYGRESILGGYVQDDVRLRPNLTLNLGLRYEMNTVPVEAKGRIGNLRNLTDTSPTVGAPLFLNNTKRNFEPRVGFAWDPFRNGKTSVRGGFGIYDALVFLGPIDKTWANEQPTGSFIIPPPGTFPTQAPLLPAAAKKNSFYQVEYAPHRSYVMQWNLSVQREIVPNLTASIGYVGNHAVHLMIWHDDVNIVLPTNSPEGYLWPCEPFVPTGSPPGCQGYGGGTVINPKLVHTAAAYFDNSALYDGLQAQLTKRMGHGFQVQGSFTWSKSIDDGS